MKRFILGALVASVVALPLVACGKNSVANAGEELKVLSKEDLKANSSEGKPIEVVFWHSFGDNIQKQLDPIIASFEADMAKEGIYIDVNAESTGGGYDGLRSRINMGIKSNSIPTMALGYPDHFANYIENGIMLPLDEFIADDKVGFTEEEKADFIQSYWKENIFTVDGKESVVGIPFNKSSEVMYYNASAVDPILTELGYISEEGYWEKPTWEQVWAVSAKIQEKMANGTLAYTFNGNEYKADSNAKYPVIVDSAANFFITSTRQWGGEGYYTRLNAETGKGEVVLNNDVVRTAQNYFLSKCQQDLFQFPQKKGVNYGSNLMLNLQSFISIGSTAGVKNNGSTKYELKVAPYPQKSYAEGDFQAVIQQGTNACILSKNSNNLTRTAAWLLIKYMTSTEKTAEFSMNTGYLPVRTSAVESDAYQAFLADYENIFDGFVAQAVNAAYSQKAYFYTDPAFSGSSTVRDKVDSAVVSIYTQDKPIQEAINGLYDALKKLKITCVDL